MRAAWTLFLLTALACGGVEGLDPEPAAEGPAEDAHAGIPWTMVSGSDDLMRVLADTSAAAVADGKTPVVYLGATWCGPCKLYKQALTDPLMQAAHQDVHIIEVDYDASAGQLQQANLLSAAVPWWAVLGADGKPVGRFIDGGAWGENTPANMAPPLTAFFRGE